MPESDLAPEWQGLYGEAAALVERLSKTAPEDRVQVVVEHTHRVIGFIVGVMTGNKAVPMILSCPSCHERHIDEGKFATKSHHTHACQHCGMVWRPAIVPTVGVQFLPGFKNEEPGFISDGFGNEWRKCEKSDCDLHVVRPGKVQCEGCDRDLVY